MSRVYLLIILSSVLLSNTILVPGDYPTIQEAINVSMDGDSIIVSSGTYSEGLYVTNSITLTNHGLRTVQKIIHTASIPCGGLSDQGLYYAVKIDDDTIKLSNTSYQSFSHQKSSHLNVRG